MPGPASHMHEVQSYERAITVKPSRLLVEHDTQIANKLCEVYADDDVVHENRLDAALDEEARYMDPYGFLSADFTGAFDTGGTHTRKVIEAFLDHNTDVSIMVFNHFRSYRGAWDRVRWVNDIFYPNHQGHFEQLYATLDKYYPHLATQLDVSFSTTPLIAMHAAVRSQFSFELEVLDSFVYNSNAGIRQNQFERMAIRINKALPFDHSLFMDSIMIQYRNDNCFSVATMNDDPYLVNFRSTQGLS